MLTASRDVSLVSAKVFFEALRNTQPALVRDTADRAQLVIVEWISSSVPSSTPSDRYLSTSSTTTTALEWQDMPQGSLVKEMLSYLKRVTSLLPAASGGDNDYNAAGTTRGGDDATASAARVLRDSQTKVLEVLAAFIISSTSTNVSEEVRRVLEDDLVFLLFSAQSQLNALENGSVVVHNAPPLVRPATPQPLKLPQALDYYWMCFYVLLLLGEDVARHFMIHMAAPLHGAESLGATGGAAIHIDSNSDAKRIKQEEDEYLVFGVCSVAVMVLRLCRSFLHVISHGGGSTSSTNVVEGTRAPVTGPRGVELLSSRAVHVGDVLDELRQAQIANADVFPPPVFHVLLGKSKPISSPPKRSLAYSQDSIHVLSRLCGVVGVVSEAAATTAATSRHRQDCATLALHVSWTVRLVTFAATVVLGAPDGVASSAAAANNSALEPFVVAVERSAQLLVRMEHFLTMNQQCGEDGNSSSSAYNHSHLFTVALLLMMITARFNGASSDAAEALFSLAITKISSSPSDSTPSVDSQHRGAQMAFSQMLLSSIVDVQQLALAISRRCLNFGWSAYYCGLARAEAFADESALVTQRKIVDLRASAVEAASKHDNTTPVLDMMSDSDDLLTEQFMNMVRVYECCATMKTILRTWRGTDDVVASRTPAVKHFSTVAAPATTPTASIASADALWRLAVISIEVARYVPSDPSSCCGSALPLARALNDSWDDAQSWRSLQPTAGAAGKKDITQQHGSSSAVVNAATSSRPLAHSMVFFTHCIDLVVESSNSDKSSGASSVLLTVADISEAYAQLLYVTPVANATLTASIFRCVVELHEKAVKTSTSSSSSGGSRSTTQHSHVSDEHARAALEKRCALHIFQYIPALSVVALNNE